MPGWPSVSVQTPNRRLQSPRCIIPVQLVLPVSICDDYCMSQPMLPPSFRFARRKHYTPHSEIAFPTRPQRPVRLITSERGTLPRSRTSTFPTSHYAPSGQSDPALREHFLNYLARLALTRPLLRSALGTTYREPSGHSPPQRPRCASHGTALRHAYSR